MTSITVKHTVSMGHRLPSYDGVCSSPHGHNMTAEVEVEVESLFTDFKIVQKYLQEVMSRMDHAMLLHTQDPLLKLLMQQGFRVYTLAEEPTTEAIAKEIFHRISSNYEVIRCTVYETDKYSATIRRNE